jgi:para-aminobenzoate synthetase component 1
VEVSNDLADVDRGGRWAVTVTFEGRVTAARFGSWTRQSPTAGEIGQYCPPSGAWSDSLAQPSFEEGVGEIRRRIGRGDVYQVNLCRVLGAPVGAGSDPAALWRILDAGNPSPYSGFLRLPQLSVVSASPELFLSRQGPLLTSGPIKGTAGTAIGFTAKDRAENLMIVDLVRNDLGRVCATGTVRVPQLMRVEPHPGLFHLVSLVSGELLPGTGWPQIFAALFPPGSVSGAPKVAALDVIADLEPAPRGPYCGAFGWIDADTGTAELAVAIRTFWFEDGTIRFGTGAGITWGSDPAAEWRETQLKARRLLALANAAGGRDSR